MMQDAIIIVQARMESTRLPGKVLKKIGNKPLILFLLDRLKILKPKYLVTAISNKKESSPLNDTLINSNYSVISGSPDNLYLRFMQVLDQYNAPYIIRVTADNPLTDCDAIKNGLLKLKSENLDYLWMDNIPKGLGCDIFKTQTFISFASEKLTDYEKEHLVPIFRNRNFLKGAGVKCHYSKKALKINYSIDTKQEYNNVNKFINQHILEHINNHDALVSIINNIAENNIDN